MPVYDLGYRVWEGKRRGPLLRWLAIPRFAYMDLAGRKAAIYVFSMAWMPFLLLAGYIYLLVNYRFLQTLGIPARILFPIDAALFNLLLDLQLFFCFIFAVMLSPDLIARDLHHRAIVLYFVKPISRWEYLLGKFAILMSLCLLLTWVQPALLFLIQWAVRPEDPTWRTTLWRADLGVLRAITLYGWTASAGVTLLALALSALVRNPRHVATTLLVFPVGAWMVAGVLAEVLGTAFRVLSPLHAMRELGTWFFGLPTDARAPVWAAWLSWGGLAALCALILVWRLRRAARGGVA
ncbi:MAG TPA: ABC transporter permease subunit [Candidatus Sumerlaeota bacterium]|nr:MAG: ABC-2 family transporter protein [candidate division BRC1 bacterium ADurb.BinA292]HOE97116.1 ABC transporter permease subunit [Candidatus Sumerlaeota bacterium]HPK01129.1 ABC transporter permease subunit [Candidatus Sumerlaeota bacterium]